MWVGQILASVVDSKGAEVVMSIMSPREHVAEEPPAAVAAAMKTANVIFCVSEKGYMSHTTARKEATAAGVKYYIIGQIPLEDLKRGVSAADIKIIKERTETVARMLTEANVARITSRLGTDITLGLTGRTALPLNPMGKVVSLPYFAEAAIAPVEGTSEGVIVADLEIVNWGYLLREPLRYTVKAGKVVDISGGKEDAEKVRKVAATDENASNIAELGIGTSHIIPLPMSGTRRDAARIGTAHIAIGRNDDIGGKTWSQIHIDSLMSQPTIELDSRVVLRNGALLI